jgi:ATP-dependent Clp protease ATP-binding subunit ClpC
MTIMFERYTDRARRAVVLADRAARDMRHPEVDTGHLLAGLAGEDGGVASQALAALGVTPERAREAVRNRHPVGGALPSGHRPFTPALKKALEFATGESVKLGCNYVATEHLLLGLIREGEDVGALALIDCGGGEPGFPAVVRAKVTELLDGYAKPAREPAPVLEPADGEIASAAFADYLKREGLLTRIGEAECARLAGVFMHGFACGAGNMAGKLRAAR